MVTRKSGLLSPKEARLPANRFGAQAVMPICLILALAGAANPSGFPPAVAQEAKSLGLLKKIHAEVKEMGPYPGEDFIRKEFFIGSDDDDDTYKDNHVAILIQAVPPGEKMKIQVTYMEPSEGNPLVKIARRTKTITCLLEGDQVSLLTSEYEEKELARTSGEILQAVLGKKKLLREVGIKSFLSLPG